MQRDRRDSTSSRHQAAPQCQGHRHFGGSAIRVTRRPLAVARSQWTAVVRYLLPALRLVLRRKSRSKLSLVSTRQIFTPSSPCRLVIYLYHVCLRGPTQENKACIDAINVSFPELEDTDCTSQICVFKKCRHTPLSGLSDGKFVTSAAAAYPLRLARVIANGHFAALERHQANPLETLSFERCG